MQQPFPDPGIGYSCSVSEHPDPAHFERHCHEYYELLYVGQGGDVVEGSTYPLKPHTLLLIRQYEFHFVCPQKNTIYKRHVFHFSAGAPFASRRGMRPFTAERKGKKRQSRMSINTET